MCSEKSMSVVNMEKKNYRPKVCCVKGCSSKDNSGLSFHKFPENRGTRKMWCNALSMDIDKVGSKKVCSLHFQKSDYKNYTSKPMLESSAVPKSSAILRYKLDAKKRRDENVSSFRKVSTDRS